MSYNSDSELRTAYLDGKFANGSAILREWYWQISILNKMPKLFEEFERGWNEE